MAKSAKRVKKAKPAARKTAGRRRPQTKPTQKKPTQKQKAPAGKAATQKPATKRRPSRQHRTTVTAIAQLLPGELGENQYVSRTLAIIEQDQRRRARSRTTRARQLEQVVVDMKNELATRISGVETSAVQTLEGLANRVKSNGMVQQAAALPDQVTGQVTEAVDSVLGRVGLMRAILHEEALAGRPARRRRRAA